MGDFLQIAVAAPAQKAALRHTLSLTSTTTVGEQPHMFLDMRPRSFRFMGRRPRSMSSRSSILALHGSHRPGAVEALVSLSGGEVTATQSF